MPKLAPLKPREVEKILLKNGFIVNVSKSSHRQYFNPRSIIRQSQLPIELFRKS